MARTLRVGGNDTAASGGPCQATSMRCFQDFFYSVGTWAVNRRNRSLAQAVAVPARVASGQSSGHSVAPSIWWIPEQHCEERKRRGRFCSPCCQAMAFFLWFGRAGTDACLPVCLSACLVGALVPLQAGPGSPQRPSQAWRGGLLRTCGKAEVYAPGRCNGRSWKLPFCFFRLLKSWLGAM